MNLNECATIKLLVDANCKYYWSDDNAQLSDDEIKNLEGTSVKMAPTLIKYDGIKDGKLIKRVVSIVIQRC